jgi:iron uptake system component EfeO
MARIAMSSLAVAVALASLTACAQKTDAEYRTEIAAAIHTQVTEYLGDLVLAVRTLQVSAPDHAWNPAADDLSINRMRDAWKDARVAWENVEGAISDMFEGLDDSMDGRYEQLLDSPRGDQNLFDDTGVIGMHAIERILYSPYIRQAVKDYEHGFAGYQEASFPATDDEAISFKTLLVQRLVDDAVELQSSWRPEDVDIGTAYRGLVGLMAEQRSKVDLAAQGAEESRYSNVTLLDLRNNITGTNRVYELFREWIRSKASSAEAADQLIIDKLDTLNETYQKLPTDSLPMVPKNWSSDSPSADALATPYGALWLKVQAYSDPARESSVVHDMNQIATMLGFQKFTGIEPPAHVHRVGWRR